MSPELSGELRRLLVEQKKQAESEGKPLDMEQWMFSTEDGTPIFYTDFLRRVWHRLQDAAKIRRRTPHNARHSWASHMLSAGANLAYVSSQLGHANPATTLRIYAHWVPGAQRVTTSILDRQPVSTSEINSQPL